MPFLGGPSTRSYSDYCPGPQGKGRHQGWPFHRNEGVPSRVLFDRGRRPERGYPSRLANAACSRGQYRDTTDQGTDQHKRRTKAVVAERTLVREARQIRHADVTGSYLWLLFVVRPAKRFVARERLRGHQRAAPALRM